MQPENDTNPAMIDGANSQYNNSDDEQLEVSK